MEAFVAETLGVTLRAVRLVTGGDAEGVTLLAWEPTGRRSSFSFLCPRRIQTCSRSISPTRTPGSISACSRTTIGSFIPSVHRIARRLEGVSEEIVPSRTYALVDVVTGSATVSAYCEGMFMPLDGAKMFVHCSGGGPVDRSFGTASSLRGGGAGGA